MLVSGPMHTMHIGVNTLFFIRGEVGGSETYLRQTVSCMAKLFPDIRMTLFTNRENDSVLKKDLSCFSHVEFRLLNFRATNRFVRIIREQVELPKRARQSRIDVLWSPGYTSPFFCHCPQVTSILDMQYKTHPDDLSFLARIVTDILIRVSVKRSAGIITISEFSKKEIVKYTLAPPDKIHAILLAAAPEFAVTDTDITHEDNAVCSFPMLGQRPYILSVANTYPHKNMHTLIDAFGKIMGNIAHNLVIIGLPRLGEEKVKKAIDGLSDPSRVIRLSRLSRGDLAMLYNRADIFVFPSLYEGFGLPILEAMISGIPVVTTKRGAIPEVGGNYAVYADPPDAQTIAARIMEIVRWDPEQRADWVQRAKIHTLDFTWEKTAEEVMKVLEHSAGNKRQGTKGTEPWPGPEIS